MGLLLVARFRLLNYVLSEQSRRTYPKLEIVSAARPNNPHKLTKSRRAPGPAAEPPRAARTARRHGGRTSHPPMLVQSRRPPRRSEPLCGGRLLQLRVSTLGPYEFHGIFRKDGINTQSAIRDEWLDK